MKNLYDVLSGLPADRRQRIELRVKEILAEETASFAKPLAAAVLLKKAVNDSADECGPDCDDYAHGESCPACDPAKWLVDQQVEIERLRSRLEMREAQMAALKVEEQPQFLQLQARLAEVERERDTAFEIWKKFHQETLAAFIKNEHEPLKLRLARAEALLSECRHFVKALCDHDDATCGCYQHLVLRGIDAFLAADSASGCQHDPIFICPKCHPTLPATPSQPEDAA